MAQPRMGFSPQLCPLSFILGSVIEFFSSTRSLALFFFFFLVHKFVEYANPCITRKWRHESLKKIRIHIFFFPSVQSLINYNPMNQRNPLIKKSLTHQLLPRKTWTNKHGWVHKPPPCIVFLSHIEIPSPPPPYH